MGMLASRGGLFFQPRDRVGLPLLAGEQVVVTHADPLAELRVAEGVPVGVRARVEAALAGRILNSPEALAPVQSYGVVGLTNSHHASMRGIPASGTSCPQDSAGLIRPRPRGRALLRGAS